MIRKGLVSILMPLYNGEQYLRQAIESALAQSHSNIELIVVDDGSTDQSAAIIRSYDDPRIRYHYQENRGQTAALDCGLDLSQGEYVTTLDADDWLTVDSLKARLDVLERHPDCGVCYGDGIYCNAAGEGFLRFAEHMPSGAEGDVYDTLIVSPFYGTGASVLVRREAMNRHGIRYDVRIVWCQDWDFYIRLAERTHFCFANTVVINYRLHDNGMTMTLAQGRRLDSLLQLRFKVMRSARFLQASEGSRRAFFYDFMLKDLDNRTDEQDRVFESAAFRSMSRSQKSALMRAVAIHYFLQNRHMKFVGRWAGGAWSLAPFDPKNIFLIVVKMLGPAIGRRVISRWQKARSDTGSLSPFEMAGAQPQSTREGAFE